MVAGAWVVVAAEAAQVVAQEAALAYNLGTGGYTIAGVSIATTGNKCGHNEHLPSRLLRRTRK